MPALIEDRRDGPLHLVSAGRGGDERTHRLPHRKLLPRERRRGMRHDVRAVRMQANIRAQEEQVMRRFHVHLGVPDLAASIRFYSICSACRRRSEKARLREVDARRSSGEFRDLIAAREPD